VFKAVSADRYSVWGSNDDLMKILIQDIKKPTDERATPLQLDVMDINWHYARMTETKSDWKKIKGVAIHQK